MAKTTARQRQEQRQRQSNDNDKSNRYIESEVVRRREIGGAD
jgi:hypothetical protein